MQRNKEDETARVQSPVDRISGRSVAAFVLGLICLCLGPLGVLPIVVGAFALAKPQTRCGSQGRGLAIAGIVMGILGVLGTFLWWFAINQALIDARFRASQSYVASHSVALKLYAKNNGGAFPNAEQWPSVLIENGRIEEILLYAPNEQSNEISYVYVPGQTLNDKTQIIVYENPEHWPARGVIVGFADGHVEVLKHDVFERMLAEQLATQSSP